MHTIKRNKKILDYLQKQMQRIGMDIPVTELFSQYIFENLSTTDSMSVLPSVQNGIQQTALDNDSLLIETLKFIGLMEVAENVEELKKLNDKRKENKNKKEDLTDFDRLLKGIMNVPKPEDKEKG